MQNAQSFKAEQERVAELQIINSIQQGLAAELDFQAIVDLVGDKLREVLNTPNLAINWYDEKANLIHYLYVYEHGNRLTLPVESPRSGGILSIILKTHQPLVFNNPADYAKLNALAAPGTDQSKSGVAIPIISSDRVLGIIGLENYERENAFGESELRLLTTIAASLGTALENARLFDETQRLLKVTEDRAAELAIINSVGEAMSKNLDVPTVVRIVGDKVRDIFNADVTMINLTNIEKGQNRLVYAYDKGYLEEMVFSLEEGLNARVINTREPLLLGTSAESEFIEFS